MSRGPTVGGGVVALERPIAEHTGGPWAGRTVVRRVQLRAAEGSRAVRFRVSATWTGPPMDGFPRDPPVAERDDTIVVDELELARAVAMAAIDELRAARVPDLRALHKRFKIGESSAE